MSDVGGTVYSLPRNIYPKASTSPPLRQRHLPRIISAEGFYREASTPQNKRLEILVYAIFARYKYLHIFLRGKLNIDDIIRKKGIENCFISEITVFELKYGAENSNNPKKSHKAVDKFVKGLFRHSYLWDNWKYLFAFVPNL